MSLDFVGSEPSEVCVVQVRNMHLFIHRAVNQLYPTKEHSVSEHTTTCSLGVGAMYSLLASVGLEYFPEFTTVSKLRIQ